MDKKLRKIRDSKKLYEITGPEAKKLVDVAGAHADMMLVREYLKRYKQEKDQVTQTALFVAALMTYRRCFTSGKREKILHKDVECLVRGGPEYHQFLMALADKLVAHSISQLETGVAAVHIKNNKVEGVLVEGARVFGYNPDDMKDWPIFVDKIISMLEARKIAASAALRAVADKKPVSEIKTWPKIQSQWPNPKNYNRQR